VRSSSAGLLPGSRCRQIRASRPQDRRRLHAGRSRKLPTPRRCHLAPHPTKTCRPQRSDTNCAGHATVHGVRPEVVVAQLPPLFLTTSPTQRCRYGTEEACAPLRLGGPAICVQISQEAIGALVFGDVVHRLLNSDPRAQPSPLLSAGTAHRKRGVGESDRSMTRTLRSGRACAASHAAWNRRNVLPEPPSLFASEIEVRAGMVRCPSWCRSNTVLVKGRLSKDRAT